MSGPAVGCRPSHVQPARMQPLARLPIFLALEGKRVLLAGNAEAAAWKADLLCAAGAHVDVFAPHPSEALRSVATQALRGAISLHVRPWQAADIAGAALAVGGFDDEDEAQRFASAARSARVPVNVIDKPAHCDFAFGAIVNRSPLVIGISTDGAAPIFAQAIRAKLEALIPRGFAHWANAARRWRATVQASGLSFAARRAFWQLFTTHAVAHPECEPRQRDFDAILARARAQAGAAEGGCITLVGAAAADAELLTLRAVRALQTADVIVIDDHVSPEIVDFARREARKMLVGNGRGETNALMVKLAKAGRRVVHLMCEDPPVRGGTHEEIAAARAAGISIEVVPGLGAAPIAVGASRRERTSPLPRLNSPGTPLPACSGSSAAPQERRVRAPQSTSPG
jgi:uroporphyrin-III C-methyltransferase/precorrin-2 dehydrogenase/sirohydrochlorin ferrochelatase